MNSYSFIAAIRQTTACVVLLASMVAPLLAQERPAAASQQPSVDAGDLLQALATNQLSSQQSSALYASLYARGFVAFEQRSIFRLNVEPPLDSANAILPEPVALASLPTQWQTTWDTLGASNTEANTVTIDLRWGKVRDRNKLSQRINRNADLIQSKHFLIEADVPAAVLPEIVRECELTYSVLDKVFSLEANPTPLWIRVFRSRAAYVKLLKANVSQVGLTSGYFDLDRNTVYCYWDKSGDTINSLHHELTHLILTNHWARESVGSLADQSDFWAFEAIATYMESLTLRSGLGEACCMLGGWESARLQAARYRRLHDLSWIPFEELRSLAQGAYQEPEDIQLRYSQSAGLAHYFFDSSAQSQSNFIRFVQSVHRGTPDASLLQVRSDEELRSLYDEFLMSSREAFQLYALHPPRAEIVLSRTPVRADDLKHWPATHRKLDWFDLSFTEIDGGFLSPTEPWQAKRWNLESTKIGDEDLSLVALSQDAVELDLSQCLVHDDAMAHVASMAKLETLWLTGTQVTNQSLEKLNALKNLRFLDVKETSITSEAWAEFLKSHPRLR